MGAELNAGTGKETTSVYARVIDERLAEAFDVMADMVFRPSLDDIDSERAVILEEIAMYEDDPQEKIFDVFGEAVFGEDPLGRAIIGRAGGRGHAARGDRRFHPERYVPANIVIAAAGAVDQTPRIAGRGADRRSPATRVTGGRAARLASGRRLFERKDTEQYHVCVGALDLPLRRAPVRPAGA